jgi:hypothetical protein
MQFKKLTHCAAVVATAAYLGACGGGSSSTADTSASVANTLVCSSPGADSSAPASVVVGLFATVYALEVGTIDPLGAFVKTSSAIFELASNNTATVDGATVPISSACYQASSSKLTVAFGQANTANTATAGTLDLSPGGKAAGAINGKAVRTKP